MKKQRSASYPPHTLEYALDFTQKIYEIYGSSYRSKREEIASALNVGVGTLNDRISASVQYGILNVKPKEGYKVTELFKRYFRPLNQEDKLLSLKEAFNNPKLYSNLLETFEGNILPPLKPLSNILFHNHNISESACEKAAAVFEENVENLGYLKEGRILDTQSVYDEFKDDAGEEFVEDAEEIVDSEEESKNNNLYKANTSLQNFKNLKQDTNNTIGSIPHNIPLKNKLPAQLLLPKDVSAADFDFIISYIGLIRNQY